MKLYLVRHGESESNVAKIYEKGESPLSSLGVTQAKRLGQRFADIQVDVIFTSHYTRAHETARILNEQLKKEIIISELIHERRYPTEVIGKRDDDPKVREIIDIMHQASPVDGRYSDEESLADMKDRAEKFLALLSQRTEERILVVTHGTFLRMVLAVMGTRESPFNVFVYLHRFFKTANTGITVCEYTNGVWSLKTWNDYAHLD